MASAARRRLLPSAPKGRTDRSRGQRRTRAAILRDRRIGHHRRCDGENPCRKQQPPCSPSATSRDVAALPSSLQARSKSHVAKFRDRRTLPALAHATGLFARGAGDCPRTNARSEDTAREQRQEPTRSLIPRPRPENWQPGAAQYRRISPTSLPCTLTRSGPKMRVS